MPLNKDQKDFLGLKQLSSDDFEGDYLLPRKLRKKKDDMPTIETSATKKRTERRHRKKVAAIQRLKRIKEIIDQVDIRAIVYDDPGEVITRDELSRIYNLASGREEKWKTK